MRMVTVLLLFCASLRSARTSSAKIFAEGSKGDKDWQFVFGKPFRYLRFLPLVRFVSGRFERAVFRWPVSYRRGKFRVARDQIGGFKFSFAGQCPRVASDIAE